MLLPHVHGLPIARGRSRSTGRETRSVPDEFMIDDDYRKDEVSDREETTQAVRTETLKLKMQVSKMEEVARDQSARQADMENMANHLTAALTTVLTQVEQQTARHNELLSVHQSCLDDINLRAEGFNDSQRALEITAAALITQRESDPEQYAHGMQALYQKQAIANKRYFPKNKRRAPAE